MLRSYPETEHKETLASVPGSEEARGKISAKVRFDYRGVPRPPRFFFGGKSSREVAEEVRSQQASLWRNIPLQGVNIEDLEYLELYSVYDEEEDTTFTYAPMVMKITMDSLEECIRFVARDEFRRLEIMEPAGITLKKSDLERILYKFSEVLREKIKEYRLK